MSLNLADLQLTRGQRDAVRWLLRDSSATDRVLVWLGGIRAGKSAGAALVLLLHAVAFRDAGGERVVVGRTVDTAWRNVVRPLHTWATALGLDVRGRFGTPTFSISGDIWHVFGGYDDRVQGVVQGMTIGTVGIDEYPLIPEALVQQLIARCSLDESRMVMTANKEGPDHWSMIWLNEDAARLGLKVIDSDTTENHVISDATLDFYGDHLRGYHKERMLGNVSVARAGMVVPRVKLVDVDVTQARRVVAGVDFGMSNPTVAVYLAQVEGQWVVVGEYVHSARSDVRLVGTMVNEMIEWGRVDEWFVDPSAPHVVAEFRHRWKRARGARNDIDLGVVSINDGFESGILAVQRGAAPQLVRCLARLVWRPEAQDRGLDEPMKGSRDPFDALRYAVVGVIPSGRYRRPKNLPSALRS